MDPINQEDRGRTADRNTPIPGQDNETSRSCSVSRAPSPPRNRQSPPHLPEIPDLAAIQGMTPQQMQQAMMQMLMQNQIMMADNIRRDREREERDRETEYRRRREAESIPPSFSEKTPHVNFPEVFTGLHPEKLEPFLTRCRQVFLLQPRTYSTEQVKVAFMASFLSNMAALAVDPLLQAQEDVDDPIQLQSVRNFSNYLQASFGDPDPHGTASSALSNLSMSGTAVEYFSNLRRYFAVLRWQDEAPMVDRARSGLSEQLKDEVACSGQDFSTLDKLSAFVIPLDNRLRARRQEKEKRRQEEKDKNDKSNALHSQSRSKDQSNQSHNLPQPSITERTTTTATVVAGPASYAPFPKLSREELDEQERKGLCRYCKEPGHTFADCLKKKAADARKGLIYPPKA